MRKKNRLLTISFLAAVLAAGITACQGPSKTDATGKAAQTEAESETAQTEPEEEAWGEDKQNSLFSYYQEMDMDWARNIDSAVTRYFKYVAFQEEFSVGDNGYDASHISKYNLENAGRLHKLLEEKEYQDELDLAFKQAYPSMTKMMEVINKISEYADMKSYVDDDFAKGKEYHKELWEAYQQYVPNMDEFRRLYDIQSRERLMQVREEALNSGQTARYEAASVLEGGKALLDEIKAQGLTDKNILEMNLETMQPLYDEFLAHVNALLELPEEESALSEGGITNPRFWDDYVDVVKETKTSMTLLLQTVREKKPISSGSSLPGDKSVVSYEAGVREMLHEYDRMLYAQD